MMAVAIASPYLPCACLDVCQTQDVEYLVDREASYKDAKRLKSVLSTVCDDLGIRHTDRNKAFLEVCAVADGALCWRVAATTMTQLTLAAVAAHFRTTATKSWRRLA